MLSLPLLLLWLLIEMSDISRPRRVLMTADAVGGVWAYALELARALGRRGIEVVLAVMGMPVCREQRAEAENIGNLRLYEHGYKLEWMDDAWDDVARAGDWLLGLAEQLRPDVVHLNGYAHGALPWRAPALVVGHSCVLSWWLAVKGEAAPSVWDRYRNEVARGLRSASLVVAPTRAMLAALEQHYGPLSSARVVPNGRSAALFPPGIKQPFIFAVGRVWDAAKNIAALESVAPHLAWPVYVAGDEKHPGGSAARHGNIRLLGRLSQRELAWWLARASIYVLPARYEPFGLSALEAALAGCALVLGDIPSLREVWRDAALFVPPNDIAALKATLDEVIWDERRRAALAERARLRALEYTPERMAAGYLAAYRELIREPQGEKNIPLATRDDDL